MPNPYHDETGRFCSGEEMGAAVVRLEAAAASATNALAQAKAFDAYFELRREYEAISRGVTEMPEEWVAAVATSGLQGIPQTADGIEAFYRSGLDAGLREPSDRYATKALDIFANPATPGWIKDEIYREASVEIKVAMINAVQDVHRPYLEQRRIEIADDDLLPFTWGDSGHSPKVTQALLNSNRLGFDVKYQLAKERGQLGSLISYADQDYEARLYKRVPDVELDLKREWKSPLRPQASRDAAARALARNTVDPQLRAELLASDTGAVSRGESIPGALAQNPHLTAAEGRALLRHSVATDGQNFQLIYSDLREHSQAEALTQDYNSAARSMKDTNDYRGVSYFELDDAQQKLDRYNRELDAGAKKYPGLARDSYELAEKALGDQGAADYWHQLSVTEAEPERYEALRREAKNLKRSLSAATWRGNRKHIALIMDEQQKLAGRIARARTLRKAAIILDRVEAEAAGVPATV